MQTEATQETKQTVRSQLSDLRRELLSLYTEREEAQFATFYNGFAEHGFSKKGLFESQRNCRELLDRLEGHDALAAWRQLGLEDDLPAWIQRTRAATSRGDAIPCEEQPRAQPVGSRLVESVRQVDRWLGKLETVGH